MRRLNQDGAQPDVALAGTTTALTARALVIAGREPCPGSEGSGGRETAHVGADLGNHHLGSGLREAWNAVEQGDDLCLIGVVGARHLNLRGKAGDALLQAVDLGEQLSQHEALVGPQVAAQRLLELRPLLAQRPSR